MVPLHGVDTKVTIRDRATGAEREPKLLEVKFDSKLCPESITVTRDPKREKPTTILRGVPAADIDAYLASLVGQKP